jgi:hypothetical protein
VTARMLCRPSNAASKRASPKPNPPWGGQP